MILERNSETFNLITNALIKNEVLAILCDTIYGFIGKAPDTEDKIREIKGREETKPFLQLVSGISMAENTGAILPDSDILSLWPGPYTFILNMKNGGTAAFRMPADKRLREIVENIGFPIFSTSINTAGMPPENDPEIIDKKFGKHILFTEDSGIAENRLPSTIVDLTLSKAVVVRAGAGIVPEKFLV
jgi:L-threonylcarbamoyladenylate synthase